MKYKLYGSSDDNAIIQAYNNDDTPSWADEVGAYNRPRFARFTDDKGDGITAMWQYSPDHSGCWMIGFIPLDEDKPIPDWFEILQIRNNNNGTHYSAEITIEVPEYVKFKWVGEDEDD